MTTVINDTLFNGDLEKYKYEANHDEIDQIHNYLTDKNKFLEKIRVCLSEGVKEKEIVKEDLKETKTEKKEDF